MTAFQERKVLTQEEMDGAALLRAILEDPSDNVVRLVYADWLDDNGRPTAAGAIRNALLEVATGDYVNWTFAEVMGEDHASIFASTYIGEEDCRVYIVEMREGYTFEVSDGMLWRIVMPIVSFMEHAASLFSRHPITRVELSDRRPKSGLYEHNANTSYDWFVVNSDCSYSDTLLEVDRHNWLPSEIGDFLTPAYVQITPQKNVFAYYPSEQDALYDLRRACVRYGRRLVGLRPLPEE